MTQEALKLALEELADRFSEGWHEGIKIDASDIMLLNEAAQALAQPEQETVGYWKEHAQGMERDYDSLLADYEKLAQPEQEPVALVIDGVLVKSELPEKYTGHLYTHPSQRTWVGLIDKDMNEPKTHIFDFIAGARWAESILKGRNT